MKKLVISIVSVMVAMSTFAQSKNFEPEYIGQVVVINADSTTTLLQKEQAAMKTSSSKFGYIPIPGSGLLDKSKVNLTVKGAESKTILPELPQCHNRRPILATPSSSKSAAMLGCKTPQ